LNEYSPSVTYETRTLDAFDKSGVNLLAANQPMNSPRGLKDQMWKKYITESISKEHILEKEGQREPRLSMDRSYVGKSLDHMNKFRMPYASKKASGLNMKSTDRSFDASRLNDDLETAMILSPGESSFREEESLPNIKQSFDFQ